MLKHLEIQNILAVLKGRQAPSLRLEGVLPPIIVHRFTLRILAKASPYLPIKWLTL